MAVLALDLLSREKLLKWTNTREGETKVGQQIGLLSPDVDIEIQLRQFGGSYCLLGIPEDIGPRANAGKGGAEKMFADFLGYFCNMQHNEFLDATAILLLGSVKTSDLTKKAAGETDVHLLRDLVNELDNRVFPIIEQVVAAGKIPIVIGGGHNNAYPLLKGSYLGLGKTPLGCINIDPHADLRQLEGRHSGNGFSYAIANGYLDKYHPIGLHQNYNNQYIWDKLKSDQQLFRFITNEDILDNDLSLNSIASKTLKFFKDMPVGLEIDIDGIRFAESSAKTPVGFSENKVRKLMRLLTGNKNIVYLNLSEGIPSPNYQTGKLLAYLVSDFIRVTSL